MSNIIRMREVCVSVFNESETPVLSKIWVTSSSMFSHGVSLRAKVSISSSQLYSK